MEKMLIHAGLICEGGGMRGMYTAGVLDYFMEKGLQFTSCYGVSAGIVQLASYISWQPERAMQVVLDNIRRKEYCSVESLLTTGDMFGADYCYRKIPEEINPYDYEAAAGYPGKAYAVATNLVTGRPAYFRLQDMHRDLIAVRASASLPLISQNVMINGVPYLDGGMSDSIPIIRSVHDGNQKNVVILTRPSGYRKKPSSSLPLVRAKYKKYPKFVEDLEKRHLRYNATLAYLEKEEREGRAFVLRPELLMKIGRIEKDQRKLKLLYMQGYCDAARYYPALKEFLSI